MAKLPTDRDPPKDAYKRKNEDRTNVGGAAAGAAIGGAIGGPVGAVIGAVIGGSANSKTVPPKPGKDWKPWMDHGCG